MNDYKNKRLAKFYANFEKILEESLNWIILLIFILTILLFVKLILQ